MDKIFIVLFAAVAVAFVIVWESIQDMKASIRHFYRQEKRAGKFMNDCKDSFIYLDDRLEDLEKADEKRQRQCEAVECSCGVPETGKDTES